MAKCFFPLALEPFGANCSLGKRKGTLSRKALFPSAKKGTARSELLRIRPKIGSLIEKFLDGIMAFEPQRFHQQEV